MTERTRIEGEIPRGLKLNLELHSGRLVLGCGEGRSDAKQIGCPGTATSGKLKAGDNKKSWAV